MPLGNNLIGLGNGNQGSATAISRGHAVLFDTATDPNDVVRAAADGATKVAGIAIEDSDGESKDFAFCFMGVCLVKNTSGGAITQGNLLITHADGGVKALAAEAGAQVIGMALETSADDDLFSAYICCAPTSELSV